MRTSKPISTISYNSIEFLTAKLEELKRNHVISDYMFIFHHHESDERKDHIHLWILPNKLVDTMELQEFLQELDFKHPDKPLGCIPFRVSKVDDWLLYTEHFEPYLKFIGQSREYHYVRSDFHFADEDSFEDMYNHAHKGSEFAQRYQILQQLQSDAMNPTDLIYNGTLPLNMATSLNALYSLGQKVGRNGRSTHTPLCDEDGVLIED